MDSFTLISFGHILLKTCLMGGVVGLVISLGEKAFDFDIRKAINNIEKVADDGQVWPVTALLIAGIVAVAYAFG